MRMKNAALPGVRALRGRDGTRSRQVSIAMNHNYSAALAAILPRQTSNIAHYTLAGNETVWVRKVGKTIPRWRYTLIGCLAATLRLRALKPVPNTGGRAAIAAEAARLQTLAAHGVRVPRLLASDDDGLMFTHLGEHTLLECIEHEDSLARWQQGLAAIKSVHERGQYLSESFARNMIVGDDGGIGFIDFEEDPGRYLPLSACQSRDYLCYLESTALILKRRGCLDSAVRRWSDHAAALPPAIADDIRTAARPMLWMRALHHPRWGKDTLRLAALAEMFYRAR